MNEKQRYELAKKRVKQQKAFYSNFYRWLIISFFLFVFNATVARGVWWSLIVFVSWGVAIAMQAIRVFGTPGLGDDWEERRIMEEMMEMEEKEAEIRRKILRRKSQLENEVLPDDELELKEMEKMKKKKWDEDELV